MVRPVGCGQDANSNNQSAMKSKTIFERTTHKHSRQWDSGIGQGPHALTLKILFQMVFSLVVSRPRRPAVRQRVEIGRPNYMFTDIQTL